MPRRSIGGDPGEPISATFLPIRALQPGSAFLKFRSIPEMRNSPTPFRIHSCRSDFALFALQFEDDRNQFLLPGYATLQFAARQRLRGSLWASAAIENVLDREYLTGIPTPHRAHYRGPDLWRAGLRWDGPIR